MRNFLLALLCAPFVLCGQIISIETARTYGLGEFVTVSGTVTTGSELGGIRYVQDGTAGIAAFPGQGSNAPDFSDLQPGDSIRISGQLKDFNGLLEIDPVTNYTLLATDRPLPAPQEVAPDAWDDQIEGSLVQVTCVTLDESGTFDNGELHFTTAAGVPGLVYIRNGHPIIDQPIPDGDAFRVSGVLGEFNGLYEIFPRGVEDVQPVACNLGVGPLAVIGIEQNALTFEWSTAEPLTSTLRFGTAPDNLDQTFALDAPATNFTQTVDGLQPATFYYAQVEVSDGTETLTGPVRVFMTQSTSSQTIEVYFNSAVLESFSNGTEPAGTSVAETEARLLQLIDEAQQTLDVAAYNTTRTVFVNALKAAHNRGVRVRYLRDDETGNQGLNPPPAFPVLIGAPGDPLMHNKFVVADADLPDAAYVWTGSMNFTNSNIAGSFNNSLLIQDQSLARTYEHEFEEMWGSDGAQPDPANARYGSAKRDDTPHRFDIGGVRVDSYFSPSDRTTQAIEDALRTADESISAALLLLTHDDLTDVLADKHQESLNVRVAVDDVTNDFQYLAGLGVPTLQWSDAGKFLHHKYGLVDADAPASDPVVITGSHNWTNAAENRNDENTLFLYDADIANQFQQEFEARWNLFTSTQDAAERSVALLGNPAREAFAVRFAGSATPPLEVFDALGRSVWRQAYTSGTPVSVVDWTPGVYWVVLGGHRTKLVVL